MFLPQVCFVEFDSRHGLGSSRYSKPLFYIVWS
jgi:hypothetical protein